MIGQRLLSLSRSQELQDRTRREKLSRMQSKEIKALEAKDRDKLENLKVRYRYQFVCHLRTFSGDVLWMV